jgi:short-subunit dehydrogenase involved in D-alanine esterification of teichoic acids
MRMSGNTIFIAGGTSGIGPGLVLHFHEADNSAVFDAVSHGV